jgi:hypothetical protein
MDIHCAPEPTPTKVSDLETAGVKALGSVKRLLDWKLRNSLGTARFEIHVHATRKSDEEKRIWMVTLVRIAVEWGFSEGVVKGYASQWGGTEELIDEAYGVVAALELREDNSYR